jgi:hypothetical protein
VTACRDRASEEISKVVRVGPDLTRVGVLTGKEMRDVAFSEHRKAM